LTDFPNGGWRGVKSFSASVYSLLLAFRFAPRCSLKLFKLLDIALHSHRLWKSQPQKYRSNETASK